MAEVIGVIGGMGPLASAEFVKSIYEFGMTGAEQESPTCLLHSDPTFPDRTQAVLSEYGAPLVRRLADVLERFYELGVSKTVICCVTMHHFLDNVPEPLRRNVISLIDVVVREVLRTKRRHLLLCTTGTRRAMIFQKHPGWESIQAHVVLPSDRDQQSVHEMIYRIKRNGLDDSDLWHLKELSSRYAADAVIAGCTELHLVAKKLIGSEAAAQSVSMVDPLLTLAREFAGLGPDAEWSHGELCAVDRKRSVNLAAIGLESDEPEHI